MKQAVAITSYRSPFEVFLLIACILGGISGFINPTGTARAASGILPGWLLVSWYAGLVLGGTCSLIGVLLHRMSGLYVERIGLTLIVGLCVIYGFTLFAGGYPLAFAAITVIAFAVACAYRLRQIHRDIKRIHRAVTELQ